MASAHAASAKPVLHEELVQAFEEKTGAKLSSKQRRGMQAYFHGLLYSDKSRFAKTRLAAEIRAIQNEFPTRWPELKKTLGASAFQAGVNYALVLGLAALAQKHGMDPKFMELTPFNATLAHMGLTAAVFLAEYKAAARQLDQGVAPASPQVAVPVAAVLGDKKAAKRWTVISAGIDVAKNLAPGGGGMNPVWNNLPGLGVRLLLAMANYARPGWSHQVIERIRLPRTKNRSA